MRAISPYSLVDFKETYKLDSKWKNYLKRESFLRVAFVFFIEILLS